MPITLQCPICQGSLVAAEKGASCQNNHQFDRARQGYLNLLPSHKMRSKHPGDDKQMIQARTRFLDSGHYGPVAGALADTLQQRLGEKSTPAILDAGCGEGYYLEKIHSVLPGAKLCGIDISKPAILACCRRDKLLQWLVASVSDIPVANGEFDAVVSVFSRCDWDEFTRVLKPGGYVLVLAPGPGHLLELRQAIYEDVRPYPVDKLVQDLPGSFNLVDSLPVTGEMILESSQLILDLLAMTPHYWHIKPTQREHLSRLQPLRCRFDMKLYVIQS